MINDIREAAAEAKEGRVFVRLAAIQTPKQRAAEAKKRFTDTASVAETESCTDHSACGRQMTWAWKEAVIVESNPLRVQIDQESATLPSTAWSTGDVVLANEYERCPETGQWQPPHDLITLTHLDEPAVVESLQHRFAQDQIYTSTGPVLLAINPFCAIRGLYGETVQKKYWDRAERQSKEVLPPHVYAIADASFRNMMRCLEDGTDANQSILVSGESGAGKTVTTKFVMKYLAALSQRSAALRAPEKRAHVVAAERQAPPSPGRSPPAKTKSFQPPSWSVQPEPAWRKKDTTLASSTTLMGSKNSIESVVLQSNPILESFGNARTVRNDNSSRFGKFIEMQFADGKLVGARIDTYLLEKVRLGVQQHGERNFHIFYELLSGALTEQELSRFFLAPTALPEDFTALAGSRTFDRRDGVSDQETCHGLLAAMRAMKFTEDDAVSVLGVSAAVLHAFNLHFREEQHDTAVLDETNDHLPAVCHLLGVSAGDLEEALTGCTIQAGREQTVRRSRNLEQSYKGLEALLQTVYGALFTYLVQRINGSIAVRDEEHKNKPSATIGVLDIFGFESFQTNSFEQLCINYCNEALQQQFNAFVLKNEQAEYEREGIEWSFIEFPENQDVLDLIEKKGQGILSILDDQCRAPGPSDKAFAINVYNQCKNQPRFSASRKQTATLQFSVHHYAGPVEYTTRGFVQKNRDELPKETTELLQSSSLPFIQELAAIIQASREERQGSAVKRNKLHRSDSTVGRATVGGQFRSQLRKLRNKIGLTAPHYVRCLKPNDLLVPDVFDTAIVAEQLRCGGILEAVRVARAGFTQHYPHADFARRYRALAWKELGGSSSTSGGSNLNKSEGKSKYAGWNVGRNGHPAYSAHSYTPMSPSPMKKRSAIQTPSTPDESKSECKTLLKVLYRKLRQQEAGDGDDCNSNPSSPVVKATTYQSNSARLPSWGRTPRKSDTLPPASPAAAKARFQATRTPEPKVSPKPIATWKRGGLSSSDFLKVGMQLGKTKVFLRHQCFESLERLRSQMQSNAAIKLNSIFRRYLARIAYLPFRDAFRREMMDRSRSVGVNIGYVVEEKKESDYESTPRTPAKFRSSRSSFANYSCSTSLSLVDKWMTSQVRDAIHNPVPRNLWGKQDPTGGNFRWVLSDGLWVKNFH